MKKLIKKNQYGGLTVKDQSDYDQWLALSPEEKRQRKINIAQSYLQSGPNITNFYNAAKAMLGGFNPKNPNIQGGIAPLPGLQEESIVRMSPMLSNIKRNAPFKNYLSSEAIAEYKDDLSAINKRIKYIRNVLQNKKFPNGTILNEDIANVLGNELGDNFQKSTRLKGIIKDKWIPSDLPMTIDDLYELKLKTLTPKKESGGKIHNTFVKGVSVIDTNKDAYKHVKKRLQKKKGGTN